MLECLLEQQPAICAVSADNKDRSVRSLFPDTHEWIVIEELVGVLKPFHDTTTFFSGSRYPTYSCLAPLLYKLLHFTLKIETDDSNILKSIKEAIVMDLKERYCSSEIQTSLLKSAFLDPRFKGMSPYVEKEKQCDVVESVKIELVTKYVQVQDAEVNSDRERSNESCETNDLSSVPGPALKKKCTVLSNLLCDVYPELEIEPRNIATIEGIESELATYRAEANLSMDERPLVWWKTREKTILLYQSLLESIWLYLLQASGQRKFSLLQETS